MKIFYHNRYRPVEPIPVVLLDLCSENSEHTLKRRRSCFPRPSSNISLGEEPNEAKRLPEEKFCLLARNPVQMEMPRDPECSIVFILEYTVTDGSSEVQRRVSFNKRKVCFRLWNSRPQVYLLESVENQLLTSNKKGIFFLFALISVDEIFIPDKTTFGESLMNFSNCSVICCFLLMVKERKPFVISEETAPGWSHLRNFLDQILIYANLGVESCVYTNKRHL